MNIRKIRALLDERPRGPRWISRFREVVSIPQRCVSIPQRCDLKKKARQEGGNQLETNIINPDVGGRGTAYCQTNGIGRYSVEDEASAEK